MKEIDSDAEVVLMPKAGYCYHEPWVSGSQSPKCNPHQVLTRIPASYITEQLQPCPKCYDETE